MSASISQTPELSADGRNKQWQGQGTLKNARWTAVRWRTVGLVWLALLTGAIALFAWLVWLLLLAPKRTEVIVLAAAPYQWPLPPNAWAAEDLIKLTRLDGETISLSDQQKSVADREQFLTRFDRALSMANDPDNQQPMIVWISMHGFANPDDSIAYLIPPRASLNDRSTWIGVSELLDRLAAAKPSRHVVLMLDCHRIAVDWNVGLVDNYFADRVTEIYQAKSLPNLSIVQSAGSGQVSKTSGDLQGSAFGYFSQLALAGSADVAADIGDMDGWVSLREYHEYVTLHLRRWAHDQRASDQSPRLLKPSGSDDIRLARSLNDNSLGEVRTAATSIRRRDDNVAANELAPLWQSLDHYRTLRLYENEPIAFRDLEHRLLWLEQLSRSGEAYRELSGKTLETIQVQIAAIDKRIAVLGGGKTLRDAVTLLSGRPSLIPVSLPAFTLPMATAFGVQPIRQTQAMQASLDRLIEAPSAESLAEAIEAFGSNEPLEFAGGRFLRMLDRASTDQTWQHPDLISRLLTLQRSSRRIAGLQAADGKPGHISMSTWIQRIMEPVDDARRIAEDQLLVGDPEKCEAALADAESQLQTAMSRLRIVRQVIQHRDRATAELGCLAQWIADPRRKSDPEQTAKTVNDLILPLIANAKKLSLQIDEPDSRSDSLDTQLKSLQSFSQSAIALDLGKLSSLRSSAEKSLILESETNEPQVIDAIDALLSIPLLDWKSRRDLTLAMDRLASRLHTEFIDSFSVEPAAAIADESSNVPLRESIARWNSHPLAQCLDREKSDADQTIQGRANRSRLAAPIWSDPTDPDPIRIARLVKMRSHALWQTQRALTDFWGAAGQPDAFFDRAATTGLVAADKIASVIESQVKQTEWNRPNAEIDEAKKLSASLDQKRSWVDQFIKLTAEPILGLDESQWIGGDMTVQTTTLTGGQVPQGVGRVCLADNQTAGNDRLATARSFSNPTGVTLSDTPVVTTQKLVAAELDDSVQLMATFSFRGHEFKTPTLHRRLAGIETQAKIPNDLRTDVTLSSPADKTSVIFVLDCSASMAGKLVDGDPVDADKSRMKIAKSALQEMLLGLATRPGMRVGVRFLGHRVGWSTEAPLRPLRRPGLDPAIPPATSPSQDVESVLPLKRFDLAAVKQALPRVAGVKPWGQSPIYLAVQQAIQEFGSADASARQHIIVITDGSNYQFIPEGESKLRPTLETDVLNAWNQKRVPIHILGLGMNQSNDPATVDAFTRLCRDCGGQFQALSGSTDLANALQTLLAPDNYRMVDLDAPSIPPRVAPLGTAIKLNAPFNPARRYEIQFDRQAIGKDAQAERDVVEIVSETVVVEGGESLQMTIDPTGRFMTSEPYDANVVSQQTMVDVNGTEIDQRVRFHRPSRVGNQTVVFPVSWQTFNGQRDAWTFTLRPSRLWIDVQPIDQSGQPIGPVYPFVDAVYQSRQPVPVVRLAASDWPADAVAAEIRVYSEPGDRGGFQLRPPQTNRSEGGEAVASVGQALDIEVAVADVLDQAVEVQPGLKVRALIDSPDGRAKRIRCVVFCGREDRPVNCLKVTMQSREPVVRTERRYDFQHQIALHTFWFEADPMVETFRLTDRARETAEANRLSGGAVRVNVRFNPTTLPPTSLQPAF